MKQLGLICKNSAYSFSKKYFTEKFDVLNISNQINYNNFELESIAELDNLIVKNPNLIGLNITIPYKETIIPFLDKLNDCALKIGAVNTIKIDKKGFKIGYNTDWIGFLQSIKPYIKPNYKKALILGNGGAAKAVVFALESIGITCIYVTRSQQVDTLLYSEINLNTLNSYQIIVNTTPLGTFPNIYDCVDFPFEFLTENHLCFDLVYNPEKTKFLSLSEKNGAKIKNGTEMLALQAEAAWNIWKYEI